MRRNSVACWASHFFFSAWAAHLEPPFRQCAENEQTRGARFISFHVGRRGRMKLHTCLKAPPCLRARALWSFVVAALQLRKKNGCATLARSSTVLEFARLVGWMSSVDSWASALQNAYKATVIKARNDINTERCPGRACLVYWLCHFLEYKYFQFSNFFVYGRYRRTAGRDL